jgi:hypothetical protein
MVPPLLPTAAALLPSYAAWLLYLLQLRTHAGPKQIDSQSAHSTPPQNSQALNSSEATHLHTSLVCEALTGPCHDTY